MSLRTLTASVLATGVSGSWDPACFVWDVAYKGKDLHASKPNPEQAYVIAEGPEECQQLCHAASARGCTFFTYYPKTKACYLEGADAELLPAEQDHVVSGPATCMYPSPTCHGLPTAAWPAATYKESMKAWPAGYQPMMAQCWVRFDNASFMPCDTITVLDDTAAGWPGKCNMMKPVSLPAGVDVVERCKRLCFDDVECSGWQVNHADECYHGLGQDCYTNPTWDQAGVKPKAAQRLMHGTYRVLKAFRGTQILGLRNVFNKANSERMTASGADPADGCRNVCLSKIRCQYWQLDSESGCWIEDPSDDCWVHDILSKVKCHFNREGKHVVPYPLTTRDIVPNFPTALEGEFIQRSCPAQRRHEAAAWTTEAPPLSPVTTRAPPAVPVPVPVSEPASVRLPRQRLAASLSRLPEYNGDIRIKGLFRLKTFDTLDGYEISYSLSGLEPSSGGGWHVHSGTSCLNPGGHLKLAGGVDPWTGSKWKSDAKGKASGEFSLNFDKGVLGRVVVVHLSDGTKAACGVIVDAQDASAASMGDPAVLRANTGVEASMPTFVWWALLGAGLAFIAAGVACCHAAAEDSASGRDGDEEAGLRGGKAREIEIAYEGVPQSAADAAFNEFDTNRDGRITRDEFQAGIDRKFDEIDENRDGKISRQEWDAAEARKKKKKGSRK